MHLHKIVSIVTVVANYMLKKAFTDKNWRDSSYPYSFT